MGAGKSLAKLLARNPLSSMLKRMLGRRVSFNHLTIRTIAFMLRQRLPFRGLTIDVSDRSVTPAVKSYLYYGIYEKNEIDLVNKYLDPTDDVIELGSSIGVMGSIVSHIQTTGKYISVEADPALLDANRKNLAINRKTDYVLLNKAVDYSAETITFAKSADNLSGKVDGNGGDTVTVETISLDAICEQYELKNFVLVCDIEGAEISIILNDEKALSKCAKIIIELHDTEYQGKSYTKQDMISLLQKQNFNLLEQQGTTCVFRQA